MGWMNREPAEPGLPSDLRKALDALRAKLPQCPKPEMLQAAQSDVLPAHQREDINKHLESCPTCKALLADLEAIDNTPLDRAGQTRIWKKVQAAIATEIATQIATEAPAVKFEKASAPRWSFWFRPASLAAMTAALTLVAVGVLWVRTRQQPPGNEAAQNRPVVQLPTPASVLQLEKAPVVLPASAAIVWRGQGDAAVKQGKDLKQALAPYESGDYAEAARRLDRLRKQYPRMAQAPFYLGVSQLFLNQNEQAARSLKAAAIGGSPLADDATWYLALANHRLGKDDVASSTLETLCKAGGKNSNRACAGVKELASRR